MRARWPARRYARCALSALAAVAFGVAFNYLLTALAAAAIALTGT